MYCIAVDRSTRPTQSAQFAARELASAGMSREEERSSACAHGRMGMFPHGAAARRKRCRMHACEVAVSDNL